MAVARVYAARSIVQQRIAEEYRRLGQTGEVG
jgi:hypothetical protein